MGKPAVVRLYDGNGLEFAAFGLVHGEQLNAVFGPRENAEIFNGECVPALRCREAARRRGGDSRETLRAFVRELRERARQIMELGTGLEQIPGTPRAQQNNADR